MINKSLLLIMERGLLLCCTGMQAAETTVSMESSSTRAAQLNHRLVKRLITDFREFFHSMYTI